LDDEVFACRDCGKQCSGHEIEMSESKHIRCIKCLNAKQWQTSVRKMV
jgi:DNA-directed RNA polymerase subunit RPC12/RpoP